MVTLVYQRVVQKWDDDRPDWALGYHIYRVGGFNPSEKYWSVGMIIPNIFGEKKFQTTNQLSIVRQSHWTYQSLFDAGYCAFVEIPVCFLQEAATAYKHRQHKKGWIWISQATKLDFHSLRLETVHPT